MKVQRSFADLIKILNSKKLTINYIYNSFWSYYEKYGLSDEELSEVCKSNAIDFICDSLLSKTKSENQLKILINILFSFGKSADDIIYTICTLTADDKIVDDLIYFAAPSIKAMLNNTNKSYEPYNKHYEDGYELLCALGLREINPSEFIRCLIKIGAGASNIFIRRVRLTILVNPNTSEEYKSKLLKKLNNYLLLS